MRVGTSSPTGRSLELYYVDGRPDGMITARIYNWTGQLLVTPRTQIAHALARPEASRGGVYLLTGETGGGALAYIGESEAVGSRIRSHDMNKDWWSSAVLVTSSEDQLNKAHVRYLEARLIQEARRIGRTPLDNGTAPARPALSEADVAKMEEFLDRLLFVLPAVRIDIFVERARSTVDLNAASTTSARSPVQRFLISARKHGLRASAVLLDGEFVVEAGSLARSAWEGAETRRSSYADLYDGLRREGVLVTEGEHAVFAKNYTFTSPSAAAAVVLGRSANGATAWRTDDGLAFKDWERSVLETTVSQGVAV